MALEVGEDDHGVVVEKVLADVDFFEPLAALDRERHVSVLIHDVDGREGPAVRLQDFAVTRGRLAGARVKDVAFHDRGGNFRLEGLHPFARNDVGAVGFTRVKFQGGAAGDVAVYELVELQKTGGGEVLREVDLGAARAGGGRSRGGRFGGLQGRGLHAARHGRDGSEEVSTTDHLFLLSQDRPFTRGNDDPFHSVPLQSLERSATQNSSDPLKFFSDLLNRENQEALRLARIFSRTPLATSACSFPAARSISAR